MAHSYDDLINDALTRVREILPWDLGRLLNSHSDLLLLDVREHAEFAAFQLPHSINVPRGILEQSCEWNYDETVPALASGRNRSIIVICRSGKRSVLAADVMLKMGFTDVRSLKLGVRGWNDAELPLEDIYGTRLSPDQVDEILKPRLSENQRMPK
ncbi:MAG: rhodanese-like domain-containing protein [Sideroxydans sp.]|nr:rhodanese-like domain-containing protein [Sideroxydans sp.]